MNKVVNIFSGLVLVLYLAFIMMLIYDLSFSSFSLKGLPYQTEICSLIALIVLLLGVLRIKRKWQGAKDMTRFKNFIFVRYISGSSLKLALLYTVAETIFMALTILILLRMSTLALPLVLPMMVTLLFLFVESTYFAIKIYRGGDAFRVGINKKAVAYFNREMHILYFVGLKKIELHQDMVNFQYKEDLNIFLPLEILDPKDRVPFRDALIETIENHTAQTNGKIIYIDDAFRSLK